MSDTAAIDRPLRYLVLASASAGRRAVLRAASIAHRVIPSGAAEDLVGPDTKATVQALAEKKAASVARRLSDELVLGCDSLLEFEGESVGKPSSPEEAVALWERLAGRVGVLWTGHHLIDGRSGRSASATVGTTVRFGQPSRYELESYVATLDPLGLAGGFSIEGRGAAFLEGIDGEPSSVIGLSLSALRRMLGELGYRLDEFWRDTNHFVVAPLEDHDRSWLLSLVDEEWGRPLVSTSGSYEPAELPGLVAHSDGRRLGALLYRDDGLDREVVLLHSLLRRCGIGSLLLADAGRLASQAGLSRLWLITTDDNLGAVNFYLANGMHLSRRHPNFAATVAEMKPSVLTGPSFEDALEFECDPRSTWSQTIDIG